MRPITVPALQDFESQLAASQRDTPYSAAFRHYFRHNHTVADLYRNHALQDHDTRYVVHNTLMTIGVLQ